MCTVLCSLLLGAGFDAYLVTGYAPLSVTSNDQTGAVCPLLEPEVAKPKHKMVPVPSSKHPVQPKEAKYKIKSDAKVESSYLQVMGHVWCHSLGVGLSLDLPDSYMQACCMGKPLQNKSNPIADLLLRWCLTFLLLRCRTSQSCMATLGKSG